MYRFLLFFLTLFFFFSEISAQGVASQSNFFKPEKSWLIKDYDPYYPECGCPYGDTYFKVTVVGDTLVNGTPAIRLCMENLSDGDKYYPAVVENDGFISAFSDEYGGKLVPLIDFNVHKGDVIDNRIRVVDEGFINLNGVNRRILTIEWIEGAEICYWIEGIGCNTDMYITLFSIIIGHLKVLEKCYDGDECIYSKEMLDKYVTGVDKVTKDVDRAAPIYDLEGRRVTNPQKGHIYIRSSKKVLW